MPRPDRDRPGWTSRRIALALGAVAGLLVVATIADPGITVDEPLDVRPGRAYVATLRARGLRFFDREVVDRVFLDNKEHPPLGRWLLGVASTLGEPLEVLRYGPDPVGIYVVSGRLAPALVFALLVFAVAEEAGHRYGRAGGLAAGFATIAMPRVFAHAHLGALDLFIAAAWSIALIRAGRAVEGDRPVRGLAWAGVFWGLALLTKIHAWLLPPAVFVLAVTRLGPKRGLAGFAAWVAVGLAVLVAGWPWLWYDTIDRLRAFLGTGVERSPIFVQYLGSVYRDRDVPWHFPWLYFGATVPVGLHGLGVVGLIRGCRERDRAVFLYGGAIAFVLGVFSTRVPVYDGERLYLLVFPLWAVVVGRGFAWAWGRTKSRRLLLALLVTQVYGVVALHPFQLSYYNLLVGGLPGAERLGLELAYWSDSVDRPLLRRLARQAPAKSTAALAPTLAPDQGKIATTRDLLARGIVLDDEEGAARDEALVVYRRTAYWKEDVRRLVAEGAVVGENARQGVWLSRLIRRPARGSPPGHGGDNP